MFTLLLINSRFFLINPAITMDNSHSVLSPHNLPPLNNYCSHITTLCPPSMMMSPMTPRYFPNNYYGSHGFLQYFPPRDDGSLMMKGGWWGHWLCTKVKLACLKGDSWVHIRRGSIRRYIITLASSLAHPSARRFFFISLKFYLYPTSFQSPTQPFASWGRLNPYFPPIWIKASFRVSEDRGV